MKKLLKWILVVISCIISLGVVFFIILLTPWYQKFAIDKPAKKMVDYVNNHPDKSALTVIKNGEVFFEKNGNQPMPLASTFKIIVASAYAEMVDAGKINSEEEIPLKKLDIYYVPNTDGGAHPAWIEELKNEEKTIDGKVTINEVVKGMIKFSSNANTEYLMDRIGLKNIEKEQRELGLYYREKPYYISSAMFIGNWLKKNQNLTKNELKEKLKTMGKEEYAELASTIHNEFKTETYHSGFDRIDQTIDKIWSDRLIKGTTNDYAKLMYKIQAGEGLSNNKTKTLHKVLETEKGIGKKGGSTEFVLTEASYQKNKNGDYISSALFLNNLTEKEQKTLFYIPSFVRIFKLAPFDGFSISLKNTFPFDEK
ncbi:serine hydrolase [Heyndrickxia sporothermodurans]